MNPFYLGASLPVAALVASAASAQQQVASIEIRYDGEGSPQFDKAKLKLLETLKIGDKLEFAVEPAELVGHRHQFMLRYQLKKGRSGGLCPSDQWEPHDKHRDNPYTAKLGLDYSLLVQIAGVAVHLKDEKAVVIVANEGRFSIGKLEAVKGGAMRLQGDVELSRQHQDFCNKLVAMHQQPHLKDARVEDQKIEPCQATGNIKITIKRTRVAAD